MKIAFDQTTELQLKHPATDELLDNGKGKPMTVEIYGKHTSQYRNAVNELFKKRAEKDADDDIDTEAYGIELLARCVKGFKNLNIETETGPLDPDNIAECFEKAFWIKDQIDRAVVKLDLFIQAP